MTPLQVLDVWKRGRKQGGNSIPGLTLWSSDCGKTGSVYRFHSALSLPQQPPATTSSGSTSQSSLRPPCVTLSSVHTFPHNSESALGRTNVPLARLDEPFIPSSPREVTVHLPRQLRLPSLQRAALCRELRTDYRAARLRCSSLPTTHAARCPTLSANALPSDVPDFLLPG